MYGTEILINRVCAYYIIIIIILIHQDIVTCTPSFILLAIEIIIFKAEL